MSIHNIFLNYVKMAIKRLCIDVQCIIDSSSHINSYKRCVEELVYNAIDAKSTSIAIRIDLDENIIEVVDNGSGITKFDMSKIGQKHMTSKCHDLATLKLVSDYYGYRGLALAYIIEVTRELKIISRHENTEQSWVTEFYKGKLVGISETKSRPSKGTTIQIKGFLYNLNIQSKSIKPIQELHDIKQFLQQLALIHNNLSLSLRDNVNNDIIFKIHKSKDIYQKIKLLFDIEKRDINELTVIKDKYKVEGYLNKTQHDVHWIYLNGRYLEYSKIHQVIDDTFTKFNSRGKGTVFPKNRKTLHTHENLTKKNIPFYIIFLTCPYNEYDLNQMPKKTLVEFQNWNEIIKLMERLVKFYYGDDKLTEIKNTNIINKVNASEPNDIRDKVKQIMQKVLGKNTKITQMQNGVRGKIIKRKKKKKDKIDFNLNKIIPQTKPTQAKEFKRIESTRHSEHNVIANQITELTHNHEFDDTSKNIIQSESNVDLDQTGLKKKRDLKNKKLRCTKTTTKYDVSMVLNDPKLGSNNQIVHNVYSLLNHLNKADEDEQINNDKGKKSITIKRNVRKLVITRHVTFPQALESVYKLEEVINNCLNKEKDLVPIKKFHSRNDLIQTILSTQKENREITHDLLRDINVNRDVCFNFNKSSTNLSYNINDELAKIPAKNNDSYNSDLSYHILTDEIQNKHITMNKTSLSRVDHDMEIANFNLSDDLENMNESHNCMERASDNKQLYTFDSHKRNKNIHLHNKLIERKRKLHNFRFISKKSQDNFSVCNNFKIPFQKKKSRSTKYNNIKVSNAVYNIEKPFHKDAKNTNPKIQILQNETFSFSNQHLNLNEGIRTLLLKNAIANERRTFSETDCGINCQKENVNKSTAENEGQAFICKSQRNKNNDVSKSITIRQNEKTTSKMNNEITEIMSITTNLHDSNKNKTKAIFIDENSSHDMFEDDDVNSKDISHNDINNHVLNKSPIAESKPEKNQNIEAVKNTEEVSHVTKTNDNSVNENFETNVNDELVPNNIESKEIQINPDIEVMYLENNCEMFNNKIEADNKTFTLRERLNFVPKGMSPIFRNPITRQKVVHDNNLEADYFSNALYKEFEKDVQTGYEVFEANVQNINELATKEIAKFNQKVKKYNADIVFDADALKSVKVLRQVDNKFIAAKITTNKVKTNKSMEYLVLFDQHAVHERIRLENNLKDYMLENSWKPMPLDSFSITLSVEEALYLHNYKEKFTQFGLQWTSISDRIIAVNAIPEAIFGKHIRNTDLILNAVKSLFQEQVKAIKDQKGSVSLYPKSIMDLVFSEACRYAIKFGDSLTLTQCTEILSSLQKCKTPFQCAHGRPVLTVLCEIKPTIRNYNVNIEKLKAFKE